MIHTIFVVFYLYLLLPLSARMSDFRDSWLPSYWMIFFWMINSGSDKSKIIVLLNWMFARQWFLSDENVLHWKADQMVKAKSILIILKFSKSKKDKRMWKVVIIHSWHDLLLFCLEPIFLLFLLTEAFVEHITG